MANYSDDFNRVDESPISGDWETIFGAGLNLVSNAVNGGASRTVSAVKSSAMAFAPDQEVSCTLSVEGSYDDGGPAVRCTPDNCYYILPTSADNYIEVRKILAGVDSQLYGGGGRPTNAGDVLKLTVTGNVLRMFVNDVQQGGDIVDNDISTGQPGLAYLRGNNGGARLDDFYADDGEVSGPTITDFNGGSTGYPSETGTINGSGFGAVEGTVNLDGVAQTVTNWTDTAITVELVQAGLKYGAHDLVVTDDSAAASAPFSLTLIANPASLQYIDAVDPITGLVGGEITSLFYGTSAITDDQLEADLVTDKGNTIQLNADGTFAIIGGGQVLETFSTRLWDQTDSTWSTREVQTINGVIVGGTGTAFNEAAVRYFIENSTTTYNSFNEAAIAYYVSVSGTSSKQFNETLRAAQQSAGFQGYWPGDRGNG